MKVAQQNLFNIHNHSGTTPKELYITPKFKTFKEEIAEYKHLSWKTYNNDILPKINEYIQTEMAKSTKASISRSSAVIKLLYNINDGSSIKFEHLLSLVLYTDQSNLCFDFSSTFQSIQRALLNREQEPKFQSRLPLWHLYILERRW